MLLPPLASDDSSEDPSEFSVEDWLARLDSLEVSWVDVLAFSFSGPLLEAGHSGIFSFGASVPPLWRLGANDLDIISDGELESLDKRKNSGIKELDRELGNKGNNFVVSLSMSHIRR